ncbi:hypothetical protein ACHAW6_011149 [Cyclotella cf. meneghiniana]
MESFNKSKVHRRASPQACTRSQTLDDSSSSSGRSSDSVNSRKWNDNDGIGRYKKWHATSKSGDSFRKDVMHSRQRAKLGGVTVGQNTSEKDESSSNSSSSSDESSSSNEEVEAVKVRQQDQRISQSEKLTSLKRKKPGDKGCVNMEFCSNHARTNVRHEKIAENITSPSQLKWHRTGQKRNNAHAITLRPCRILSPEEAYRAKRKYKLDVLMGHSLVQFLIYTNTTTEAYDSVGNDSLFPFQAKGTMTLDEKYLAQYLQQQSKVCKNIDLEAERLFLIHLFEHAVRIETESKKRTQIDLENYYHANDFIDDIFRVSKRPCDGVDFKETCEEEEDVLETPRPLFEFEEQSERGSIDDEFLDAPYTQSINFDPDLNNLDDGISNEPIRPGDVIEYYSPIFVVGDKRGLRQTTVLCVDPKADVILGLSNGECLPEDTRVKRIKVMDGNELVDHPGIYRPIETFKLVAAKAKGYNTGDGIMNEAARFGDIFRKNVNKMKAAAEAEGFAPMDMVLRFNGGRRANDQNISGQSMPSEKKIGNPSPLNNYGRLLPSSSSSSESSTSETSKVVTHASNPLPRSSKIPSISPIPSKRGNSQVLPHSSSSSSSSSSSDSGIDPLSEVRREKIASHRVTILNSPNKITCTSRNTDKENIDNTFVGKNASKSSPASLGTSLASSPASLGPSLASSPASLGTSLASSSSSSDDSVGFAPTKSCKVNTELSSPREIASNEPLKRGSEVKDLSSDLSSESSTEGLTKMVGKHKKRCASSINTLSEDDLSESEEERPSFKGKLSNSFKSSQKSVQSQSSLSDVTAVGWTKGKSGWVKAASVPGFSLSFSRQK